MTAMRPGRLMPSLADIVSHWADSSDFGDVGMACFRCGWRPPNAVASYSSRYLERAHLVDRCGDGLDGPQNLILLCPLCHRRMPSFLPGEEADAVAWVAAGSTHPPAVAQAWQAFTDALGEPDPCHDWSRFCEVLMLALAEDPINQQIIADVVHDLGLRKRR